MDVSSARIAQRLRRAILHHSPRCGSTDFSDLSLKLQQEVELNGIDTLLHRISGLQRLRIASGISPAPLQNSGLNWFQHSIQRLWASLWRLPLFKRCQWGFRRFYTLLATSEEVSLVGHAAQLAVLSLPQMRGQGKDISISEIWLERLECRSKPSCIGCRGLCLLSISEPLGATKPRGNISGESSPKR